MIAQIFGFLGTGVDAVIHWFYDILSATFGNVENFLFIFAPILILSWLLKILGVFSGGSDSARLATPKYQPDNRSNIIQLRRPK